MTDPTYADILCAALEQSALDCACAPSDFAKGEHVVTISRAQAGARRDLSLPHAFDMVSYGSNVVASVREELVPAAGRYLAGRSTQECFAPPALHELGALLAPFGLRIGCQSEYYLPDPARMRKWDCAYALRVLQREDFCALYLPQWGNALCAARREYDVLCVGAYDGDSLAGLAGCSADGERLWQIGIDVLPEYRNRGVARALVSRLAREAFARGKVPFYCAAWSNILSQKTALACGFVPAWVQLTAKPVHEKA